MTDAVGRAIAATGARPPAQQWKGRIALRASGREVGLMVPADLTPLELVDLIPASRILVPV